MAKSHNKLVNRVGLVGINYLISSITVILALVVSFFVNAALPVLGVIAFGVWKSNAVFAEELEKDWGVGHQGSATADFDAGARHLIQRPWG